MPTTVYQTIRGKKYAYSSISYWDKNKKAPRTRRVYLGAVDEETGEIIPSKKRRKEMEEQQAAVAQAAQNPEMMEKLSEVMAENEKLQKQVEELKAQYQQTLKTLADIISNAESSLV